MGEVYLAEDTLLRRKVALKLLPPSFQQDISARKRFLHEARSAAGLEHANICTIHEVGECDGKDFIVMEYVDGLTLRDRLAQSALPLQQALQIAIEITEALEEAHEKGIVHRDLKPANIMLTRKGHAKVMDFGLAKQLLHSDQFQDHEETISVVTMDGTPVGTLAYMSPEQLRGGAVECRSDVFSLGVVFYEMTGGMHPFRTSSFLSTSDRILHEEPLPIRRLNPEIPEQIEKLLNRMLAKDPARRPGNAREVLAELRACLHPEVSTGPASTQIGLRLKRRPKTTIAAGAILMILLIAAIPTVRRAIRRNVMGTNMPSRIHMAVLPFVSVNITPDNAALVQGLTEALNARLTRVTESHAIQVVPASEVRDKKVQTAEQARREFGVNLALQGSMQQAGNMVRITIALIDVHARRQLHADTITTAASDPFAWEDQVIASVLDSMEVELQPREKAILAAHGTRQPAAYDYYLRARGYLQDYQKPESIQSAIDVFRRALELDRKYALAYAGLGEAFWQRYRQTQETKWIGEALTACEQAVSLDNRLASGYACLGTVHNGRGRYEQAVEEFQHAVALDPTSDNAFRGLALAYESLGNLADAEKTYHRAIELRPQYWAGYSWVGGFYARQGRYGEAAEMFTNVTKLAPDSFVGFSNLGGILAYEGRYAEAIPMFERSVTLRPTGSAYSNLGTAYFYQRKFDAAARAFEAATRLYENELKWMIWGNLADAYYFIPEKRAQATDAYTRAISLGEQRLQVNPRNATLLGYMAYYHAMQNDPMKSQSCARRGLAVAPRDPELLYNLGLAYHQLGDLDQAFGWLAKALAAGYSRATVRDTPILDDLRPNPEFQELLKEH
jgi:eukaryotic-like serine/threonine-protein kinase